MSLTDDFDGFSWHDNAIHGMRIVEGSDGCSGDLILDIDLIVEWLPPEEGENTYRFRVAPADLTFHEVTDLVISVNYVESSAALQPMTIHNIHRELVTYPTGYSSFAWKIDINWPRNSYITFRSSGFTQATRKAPVTSGTQSLSPSERSV